MESKDKIILCKNCGHSKYNHNVEYGTGHNVRVGNLGCSIWQCKCKKFEELK